MSSHSQELILSYVSRETYDKLQRYVEELLLWNQSLNLISSATVSEVWSRHILDSVQIIPFLDKAEVIVDFGSGGGLPAIPVALEKECTVIMIESDRKKYEFLAHCKRIFHLKKVEIICKRIEEIQCLNADLAVSRACSSLDKLCGFMHRHVSPEGKGFFLKGKTIYDEIMVASSYGYDYTLHRSITDESGVILEIQHLRKST
ncbi:MAG: 16S rRNA (guanine(527)-N(7))-methyltransferase RsmG [Alphaproteobacteria bacterium]|nr:MAG: 16S rRNA (guanine(527)-N(7))-methyltransferase RsmG [Alphaproteobacteria bacterium]TAF15720.1 MAG: 16S rRNA (guanine(527)-N(7))-methyltransferase RsmG [Alphaproteobacteria bacterium]TAF40825.1 MAG: 16S rRNA (guanine(527)-N(7))-methyltransferase RsmG [Alphaproteobacteria bacterium]TAF77013.1 MAG: 16S rRNA (guanine(527)-N(7))-methyltransferase RsmG [Alphaproteobacteria bacterium]